MEFGAEVFGFEAWAEIALLGNPELEGWENHLCPSCWENVVARG